MSDNNSGAINVLNKLRSDTKQQSRLDQYISNQKTIDHNTTPSPSVNVEQNEILMIHPSKIIRWEYKDRPKTELGDIESLAKNIRDTFQIQPCIVRPYPQKTGHYELIVGECRWEACKINNQDLKCICMDLTNREASLAQAAENEKRQDISEYAKGISYSDKIDKGFITQSDLVDVLGISRQQVSRLLSFGKIDNELKSAIGDLTSVSARTASELNRLVNKGSEYKEILIKNSDKIKNGIGATSIENIVKKHLSNTINSSIKISSNNGRHLFTWRNDNNNNPSIHFPKDINQLLNREKDSLEDLNDVIKEFIVTRFKT